MILDRFAHTRRRRKGFTLIDLMIVLVILGIIAAIVAPMLKEHVERAQQAAAESTLASTEKAISAYAARHGTWPPAITQDLYLDEEPPTLPEGYALSYDPSTGDVDLVQTP